MGSTSILTGLGQMGSMYSAPMNPMAQLGMTGSEGDQYLANAYAASVEAGSPASVFSLVAGMKAGMSNVKESFTGLMPGMSGFSGGESLLKAGTVQPAEYRKFGVFSGSTPIPVWDPRTQIVPVVATTTGLAPRNRWERMGAPAGITYRNPEDWVWGKKDPLRPQIFGRLGSTRSGTLLLHPELYKPLPGGHPSQQKYGRVSKSLSLIDAPKQPAYGTAEGVRYHDILRKEVAGANMHFNPTTGQWQTRKSMLKQDYQSQANEMINKHMMKMAMKGRFVGEPVFTGHTINEAWRARLGQGKPAESITEKRLEPTLMTAETQKAPILLGGKQQMAA
mgnify:CR=1 FL=1